MTSFTGTDLLDSATKTLLDHLPSGILLIAKDLTIRYANAAAARMVGLPQPEDLVGRDYNSIVSKAKGERPPLGRHMTIERFEQLLIAGPGDIRPVMTSTVPLLLDGEEVSLEALCDMTDRKCADIALKESQERFRDMGFSAHLTKPVKRALLHHCLAQALGLEDSPPAPEITTPPGDQTTPNRPSEIRILLAEDNPINQRVALRVLEKAGHHVDLVANGDEALQALRSKHYDLVLMDCQMPLVDGYEATRAIRRAQDGQFDSRIPVIAMTANAIQGDRERCIQAGMNDYVAKPVLPEILVALVAKWAARLPLEGAGSAATNQESAGPSLFHLETLRGHLLGDDELANEVIDAFLQNAPTQMARLREAYERGDTENIRRQAHSIKGAAGTLSAFALHETAARLEAIAGEEDHEAIGSWVRTLEESFEALERELKRTRNAPSE